MPASGRRSALAQPSRGDSVAESRIRLDGSPPRARGRITVHGAYTRKRNAGEPGSRASICSGERAMRSSSGS